MSAFYRVEGDRIVPSELTRGPWDPGAQHAGPPAALLGRAIERCESRAGMRVGRITFEILGPVPLEPLRVEARVVRPGRSVEMLEASLHGPGGEAMRARAWRIAATPGLTLDAGEPPPAPGDGEERPFFPGAGKVGYHTAMEYRFVSGSFRELGPAVVWLRQRQPLVEGEQPTALERLLVVADTGNGVSAVVDYRTHLFINTDLSVHVLRPPAGEWICLEATTYVDDGVGLSDTVLWDERGRVGRAAQTLLVRPR